MQTRNLFIALFIPVLLACQPAPKTSYRKINFGVYKTIKIRDIPASVIDSLQISGMQSEKDSNLPIIGYIPVHDSLSFEIDSLRTDLLIEKTTFPVDKEGKYYAVVALVKNPSIKVSDIKNAKNKGNTVLIYLTMKGSAKWADVTRKNTGNMIGITIDNQIYTLTKINSEILEGVIKITGLRNNAEAKEISGRLNSGRKI